jgi:DNA-binding SARP family transcriptional activator/tetratricopeptide (TPR) repeat protein
MFLLNHDLPDHAPITLSFMIELRVFGPARMTGPAHARVDAVLVQPKRLALLAYLALASPEPMVSRDALLAMFWPDSDERRAREALRQALRFLRRAMGPDVVVTRGRNWVGVNRARMGCDVWWFESRLEVGDDLGALELYGGTLLEGLEIRGTAAFDQWLTDRRRELARQATAAAWRVAEAARDGGDAAEAVARAWQAHELDLADEESVRRLMGMQLWAGDRAGALRTYEDFEAWLASSFGATPSVRTRELAARARGPAGIGVASSEASQPSAGPVAGDGHPAARGEVGAAPAGRSRLDAGAAGRGIWVSRRALTAAVVAAALVSGAGAVGWLLRAPRVVVAAPVHGADDLLVVMPFQVRGADVSLGFLRHGMAELLGAVFTGDVGPEAVSWRSRTTGRGSLADGQDPDRVARRAGARWLLSGEVMGNQRDVRISASLSDLAGEGSPLTAVVSGPADSIYGLARELGGRLLAMERGYRDDEAARLARTNPAALHAYLLGRKALHQGRYEDADVRFRRALRHDPRFAQAAVGLVETHLAAPWLRGHVSEMALPLALRLRDRLGPAERELVAAAAGPRYPASSTHAEHLQAWERAVSRAPDSAPIWHLWGDALFHIGPFIGVTNHRDRARAAFEQALRLDPTYLLPLTHLIEMAAEDGDGARASSLFQRLLDGSLPAEPINADYLRWRVALASGDTTMLEALRTALPEISVGSLGAIVQSASFLGVGLDDADRIAALDCNQWSVPSERWTLLIRFHHHALNRGRPSVARQVTEELRDVAPTPGAPLHLHVRSALVAGGDPVAAREAATQLEAHVGLGRGSEQARRPGLVADVCALEVWKLSNRDTRSAASSLRWLRDPALHDHDDRHGAERCAVFLEALLTTIVSPHRVADAVARVQVLVDQGVQLPGAGFEPMWLFLADALEQQGDLEGALRVVRRRSSSPFMLAEQLLREGRLAARLGDVASARRAYAHYLALRSDPEPPLRAEMLAVRAAYEALEGRLAAN